MRIESHLAHGFESETVEVISTRKFDIVFERDEDTPYKRVLTTWGVYTTYRHDEFYHEETMLLRASVIHPYNGEKLCKADLSDEEMEKLEAHISNLEFN